MSTEMIIDTGYNGYVFVGWAAGRFQTDRGERMPYYPDPWAFNRMHYDAARQTLYIFGELTAYKKGNRETSDMLFEAGMTREDRITADSAEPKSISAYSEAATPPLASLGRYGDSEFLRMVEGKDPASAWPILHYGRLLSQPLLASSQFFLRLYYI